MAEVRSSSASAAPATADPADSVREARRRQVFVGELAPDFLRITTTERGANPTAQRGPYAVGGHATQFVQQPVFNHVPPNAVGRLVITVNQAKLAKNYGITRMDPYCRLIVGHHVLETPTAVNGSKNPRWNKSFAVFLPDGVDAISIEIYNEMTFAEDDRIAWSLIQLPARIFEGLTVDDWYTLSGRQGDEKEGMISLVMTLESLPPPPPPVQQVHYVPAAGYYPAQPLQYQQHPPQQQQRRQQVVVPVAISDADIGSVQEMFPDTDTEVIKSVLEAHGGNKDAAITALLQMS